MTISKFTNFSTNLCMDSCQCLLSSLFKVTAKQFNRIWHLFFELVRFVFSMSCLTTSPVWFSALYNLSLRTTFRPELGIFCFMSYQKFLLFSKHFKEPAYQRCCFSLSNPAAQSTDLQLIQLVHCFSIFNGMNTFKNHHNSAMITLVLSSFSNPNSCAIQVHNHIHSFEFDLAS